MKSLAVLASFGGLVFYLAQAVREAHLQTTMVDEGLYLYTGWLYVQRVLQPFQDYGVYRAYAPLSLLIPGQIEAWFGPGLRTGRYFSIVVSGLMLLALWLAARKWAGEGLAAAMIWAVAATPLATKLYSLATPHVLVACLLAWSLYLILGEKSLWRISLGALAAGTCIMVRHNMILLLPLLVAYVWWTEGGRRGLLALAFGMAPIVYFTVRYWPGILQLWAVWVPRGWLPFLDPFRWPEFDMTVAAPDFLERLKAFAQVFHFHYFTMLGLLVVAFLWPQPSDWKTDSQKRAAWFLALLFLALFALHVWGSLFNANFVNWCLYCIIPYLAFFSMSAWLLVAVTFVSWRRSLSAWRTALLLASWVLVSFVSGYSGWESVDRVLQSLRFPGVTRGLDPRLWFPGFTIYEFLRNKYGLEYLAVREIVPALALAGMALLVGTGILVWHRVRARRWLPSAGVWLAGAALVSGYVLSPLLGGDFRDRGSCGVDILDLQERIGRQIAAVIPPGSQLNWEADNVVPLLYVPLPAARVYPPQIGSFSAVRYGGDADVLFRNGFWNEALAAQWRAEANVVAIEGAGFFPSLPEVESGRFAAAYSWVLNPCRPENILRVYVRSP